MLTVARLRKQPQRCASFTEKSKELDVTGTIPALGEDQTT